MKEILLRSAEKMPEENYSSKPTEAVPQLRADLGRVADTVYFCSIAFGEKNPGPRIEKTKTSKADFNRRAQGRLRVLR
jgi:hypothetical protein